MTDFKYHHFATPNELMDLPWASMAVDGFVSSLIYILLINSYDVLLNSTGRRRKDEVRDEMRLAMNWFFFLGGAPCVTWNSQARHHIQAIVVTFTTDAAMLDPIVPSWGLNLPPGAPKRPPIPLHHSRNSKLIILEAQFWVHRYFKFLLLNTHF